MPQDRPERINLPQELKGEVSLYQPIAITQISEGGMRVTTTFPLHLESLHEFRLTLGELSVVVKGRVVHCRLYEVDQERVSYAAGIEFIDVPERIRSVLRSFVGGSRV